MNNHKTVQTHGVSSAVLLFTLALMLFCFGWCPCASAASYRLYVSPEGSDAAGGFSWVEAKATIQGAIDTLLTSFDSGDQAEIWVAAGSYISTNDSVFNISVSQWGLNSRIVLLGGFAGHEESAEARDWIANRTVIDGEGLRHGAVLAGCVVRIDGFVFDHCQIAVFFSAQSFMGTFPRFDHCLFQNSTQYAMYDAGTENLSVTASNCIFSGPRDYVAIDNPNRSFYLNHCLFEGVTYLNLYLSEDSASRITNTIFLDTYAPAIPEGAVTPLMIHCLFYPDQNPLCHLAAPGGIFCDPGISQPSPGVYEIDPESPCVDMGKPVSYISLDNTDFLGNPRLQGKAPDIGPFEVPGDPYIEPEGETEEPVVRIYVSPSGDDDHDGLSWAAAKATPQGALDALAPYDRMDCAEEVPECHIWIAAGVYTYDPSRGFAVMTVATLKNVVLFGGFNGTESRLEDRDWNQNPTVIDGGGQAVGLVYRQPDEDEINDEEGDAESDGPGKTIKATPSYCCCGLTKITVDGLIFDHCYPGVKLESKPIGFSRYRDEFRFIHCRFQNSVSKAIDVTAEVNAVVITNCIFDGARDHVQFSDSPPPQYTILTHNVFSGNENPSIFHIHGEYGWMSDASHNIFYHCATPQFINSADPYWLEIQLVRHSIFFPVLPRYVSGNTCFSKDPCFVDPVSGDFRIQSMSPCIDAGDHSGIDPRLTDMAGNPRFQGTARDIGAYEFSIEDDPTVHHSADTEAMNTIDISELLRVIQFYNSGGFHCAVEPSDTEDGYVPGADPAQTGCAAHASDYNPQDWKINLTELLRLIQLYNSPAYRSCPEGGTEDGFCILAN